MLKKVTKLVINNLGLKLMAVLFAVILWLVVVNIDDPTQTKTFTTSVTIENQDAITDMGKYYEIVDGGNTVSFKVSAKRSVLRVLSNADFKAVADMSKIEDLKRVPIEVTATRYTTSVSFPATTQYLEVNVEDLQTKQLVVDADYTGTPAENCAVGDVNISSSNVLKVSGPASVVSTISSAKAVIDVEGMSTSITDAVVPILYDADGNVVNTTKLTLNMDTVNVTADILDVKYVSISAAITGTPQSDYVNTGVTYSPQTVAVKGAAVTLNAVNSIDIPEGIVDIDGATESVTQTVDISSYLPEGVTLANDDDKKIDITVTIEAITTKSFSIPEDNITFTNVASGYQAALKDGKVSVSVRGLQSDLDKLTVSDIKGIIDMDGLGEGDHSVAIELGLDDTLYTVSDTQTAIVTVSKETASTGDGTSNTGNTNTNSDDSSDTKDDSGQDDAGTGSDKTTGTGTTTGSQDD